jgi:hypothetical protein
VPLEAEGESARWFASLFLSVRSNLNQFQGRFLVARRFFFGPGLVILRASLPARWTARHMYQLAMVRQGRQRSPNLSRSFGLGILRLRYVIAQPF